MFNFEILHSESSSAVRFDGDVDIEITEIMENEIAPKLAKSTDIEFNFENVSFVDSSGIGLLITLINQLQDNGKRVVITKLKPDVKQVFLLLQLPDILGFRVFRDFQENGE